MIVIKMRMVSQGKGVGKVDPKFLFVALSNEANFVMTWPSLVYPLRGNSFFAQGNRHERPYRVFVDKVSLCLHSDLPLGVVADLVKSDDINLISGKRWSCQVV